MLTAIDPEGRVVLVVTNDRNESVTGSHTRSSAVASECVHLLLTDCL